MHTIHLINKIDTTDSGPAAITFSGTYESVFLSQGSLDGACGHYCVFMCLLINGIIDRDDAINALGYWKDGRTNLGKLATRIKNEHFFNGTSSEDIVELFDGIFKKELLLVTEESGKNLRNFIVENIQENNPVMLGLRWNDGAHWVTVIGLDYAGKDDKKDLYRFLLLDPSGTVMEYCAWNGVLDIKAEKGRYPYKLWGQADNVSLRDAIAFVKC